MDEPTNHLDMRSKSVLQEALLTFEGSYLIVSHDRDFLEPIVNRVLDIKDGQVRVTLGSVSDYLAKRHGESETHARHDTTGREVKAKTATHLDRDRKREEARLRQERYQRVKPLKNAIVKIEQAVTRLEQRVGEIEIELGKEETYHSEDAARKLQAEYKSTKEELDSKYFEWAKLQTELEESE
jgi:ATP-binding cassette subfamily F protein 3